MADKPVLPRARGFKGPNWPIIACLLFCAAFWSLMATRCHAMTRYETDVAQAIQRDEWKVPGNCVDKAHWAMGRLEATGFAPSRLHYLVLGGYGVEAHMVVVIDNEWALDSQTTWLTPIRGYQHPRLARYESGEAVDSLHQRVWTDGRQCRDGQC